MHIIGLDREIIKDFEPFSSMNIKELEQEFKKMESSELEQKLHNGIYALAECQALSEVLNHVFEKAIIHGKIEEANKIIEKLGLFEAKNINPSPIEFLEKLKEAMSNVTKSTLGAVRVLSTLRKFIDKYPLQSIEIEFSYLPKIKLQFLNIEK